MEDLYRRLINLKSENTNKCIGEKPHDDNANGSSLLGQEMTSIFPKEWRDCDTSFSNLNAAVPCIGQTLDGREIDVVSMVKVEHHDTSIRIDVDGPYVEFGISWQKISEKETMTEEKYKTKEENKRLWAEEWVPSKTQIESTIEFAF